MERVETLLQKLQQQFIDKASAAELLLTVQMLQHELMYLQSGANTVNSKMVTISMPLNGIAPLSRESISAQPEKEEKVIEVLDVDEAAIEAELEEIKKNAATMQKITVHSRPQYLFDSSEEDEIPTLAHQQENKIASAKEINEVVFNKEDSLNDKLKANKTELSDKFNESSIKDLKKAIGVNDRFLFIKELFRGDEAMYERSIKTINGFSIFPEAEYWIRRELKIKLGWIDSNEMVKEFDKLVKRRFL